MERKKTQISQHNIEGDQNWKIDIIHPVRLIKLQKSKQCGTGERLGKSNATEYQLRNRPPLI